MNYLRANLATVGTQQSVVQGGSLFERKHTPFVYLLLTNGTLLHTYLELCTPFNRWKCTVFQI